MRCIAPPRLVICCDSQKLLESWIWPISSSLPMLKISTGEVAEGAPAWSLLTMPLPERCLIESRQYTVGGCRVLVPHRERERAGCVRSARGVYPEADRAPLAHLCPVKTGVDLSAP